MSDERSTTDPRPKTTSTTQVPEPQFKLPLLELPKITPVLEPTPEANLDPATKQVRSDIESFEVSPEESPIGNVGQSAHGIAPPAQITTQVDQEQYLMSIPQQGRKADSSLDLLQLEGEATRTRGGIRDRIAQDSPKRSDVAGFSQDTVPVSEHEFKNPLSPLFDHAARLMHVLTQKSAQAMGSIEPGMTPEMPSVKPRTPGAQPTAQSGLRDIIANWQNQVSGLFEGMMQKFEAMQKTIRTQAFISPSEEEDII